MDVAWLEDFLALVEHGGFRRAAEARNVTQPAFSRRVRTLEDWVGAPLFDRDPQPVALTPAGEAFRPMAEDVVRRVALGREEARAAARDHAATVRFASTHALSLTVFPDLVRRVEDVLAGATISLVADNMAACEDKMLRGEAHVLLCHHHPSAATALRPDHFAAFDVGADALVPASVPDADGAPLFALPGTAEAPVAHLAFTPSAGMGRIFDATRALDMPPCALRPVFRSHVAFVLAAMARDGRGVAWLPASIIAADRAAGTLVRAGGPAYDVPIAIRLVRPRARQSAAAEAVWAALRRLAP